MSDDFEGLIDSLGHMALSLVGGHSSHIRITVDPALRTAHVVACTQDLLSDDEYDSVLARLVELHDFYMDELSLSFAIEQMQPSSDDQGGRSPGVREFAYSG